MHSFPYDSQPLSTVAPWYVADNPLHRQGSCEDLAQLSLGVLRLCPHPIFLQITSPCSAYQYVDRSRTNDVDAVISTHNEDEGSSSKVFVARRSCAGSLCQYNGRPSYRTGIVDFNRSCRRECAKRAEWIFLDRSGLRLRLK